MFTTAGYVIALCRLVDGLSNRTGEARQIISQFGRVYRSEIPRDHLEKDSSGALIWSKKVQWSRQSAVMLGWMDSPARGIWRVTSRGHEWLRANPNATRIPRLADARATYQESKSRPPRRQRITRDKYHEFFQDIEAHLSELLPAAIQAAPHHFQTRANFCQVIFDEFSGCHYQITLRRAFHEIGLHFESSRAASHARLRAFQPHLDELTKALGVQVQGELWRRNAWARVWLEHEAAPLNQTHAARLAEQCARFITATFPILESSAHVPRARRAEKKNGGQVDSPNPMYQALDHQVEAIHAFLEGRSDHRPTDEKICDWIQFCYWFELYAEGRDLYKVISADGVNPWYWERTRKLAKICELRAQR